jgi:hypothetical protein
MPKRRKRTIIIEGLDDKEPEDNKEYGKTEDNKEKKMSDKVECKDCRYSEKYKEGSLKGELSGACLAPEVDPDLIVQGQRRCDVINPNGRCAYYKEKE